MIFFTALFLIIFLNSRVPITQELENKEEALMHNASTLPKTSYFKPRHGEAGAA